MKSTLNLDSVYFPEAVSFFYQLSYMYTVIVQALLSHRLFRMLPVMLLLIATSTLCLLCTISRVEKFTSLCPKVNHIDQRTVCGIFHKAYNLFFAYHIHRRHKESGGTKNESPTLPSNSSPVNSLCLQSLCHSLNIVKSSAQLLSQ